MTRVSRTRRPGNPGRVLDRIAVGLLALGVIFVVSGLLPFEVADGTVHRVLPLLLFLGTVIVLAELTAQAQVFDVIAARVAGLARGNYVALFGLCVLFASSTTAVLNLDTTAVLLTPVMLALARKVGIAAIPLAMTTVWLANTASLLLPVSNLTNLLAANRVALRPEEFAGRMWSSQLAAVAVTMSFLWVFYWRRNARGTDCYDPPPPFQAEDGVLFRVACLACSLFVIATFFARVELGYASAVAAAVLVIGFAMRQPGTLRLRLIPWRLLVFVTGLFLVMQTISMHGLGTVTRALIGDGHGPAGDLRAALTGAGLANAVNNLPAYVAGESVIPSGHQNQLLALLIGTNLGPVITPWASLATLLWFERCRAYEAEVPLRKFMLTGAGLALCSLGATICVLLLSK